MDLFIKMILVVPPIIVSILSFVNGDYINGVMFLVVFTVMFGAAAK